CLHTSRSAVAFPTLGAPQRRMFLFSIMSSKMGHVSTDSDREAGDDTVVRYGGQSV
ncbi:hypothetical protein DFQ26_009008, partial [Actinomortierella ambigua]